MNFAEGRNTPPGRWRLPPLRSPSQYERALRNFRRFARWLREEAGVEVMTIGEVNELYLPRPAEVGVGELLRIAGRILEAGEPLVSEHISPAEQALAMARAFLAWKGAGRLPERVEVKFREGPAEEVPTKPVPTRLGLDKLAELAGHLLSARGRTLPAEVDGVPLHALYGALALALTKVAKGRRPAEVSVPRLKPYPKVAEEIAEDLRRSIPGWMHKPDLDVSRIIENTVRQTWTLCRAARAPS